MMDIIKFFIDFVLHLDVHLNELIASYGTVTYFILFIIVFCETGLVVTPLLPGDSLLFAAGALAATGDVLNPVWLFLILGIAAVLGDLVNYHIGYFLGPKVFFKEDARFLKKEYLDKTHRFYERYGGKTIIIARFVPIVRTFAPFVAGIGKMGYFKFAIYNITGGLAWVASFIFGGYFFGNIPIVKNNFTLVIIMIIIISMLPGFIEYFNQKRASKQKTEASQP
jgi:membrane-associated protein